MKRSIVQLVSMIFLCVMSAAHAVTLGEVSDNVLGPVGSLQQLIYVLCYCVGGATMLGGLMQYKTHRQNPTQVRLPQAIGTFILGICIALLPIIAQLSVGAHMAEF